MKKRWSILLCAALLCALCACGGGQAPEDTQNAGEPAMQDEPAPRETAPSQEGETPEEAAGQEPEELTVVPAQDASPAGDAKDEETPPPAKTESPAAPAETSKNPPAPKQSDKTDAKPAPEPEPAPAPAPAPEPEPAPAEDRKAVAQGLVGHPVSELYAAIGRPLSSDYAPSCLIDGEDGELVYDGFVVYTEKGADYETVYAVF